MSHLLMVRLGRTEQEPVTWIHVSTPERRVLSQGQADNLAALQALPVALKNSDVTVLVPADAVILQTVQASAALTRQSVQALAYLLEEQVTSDVEALHVVVLAQEAHHYHVMAVDRSELRGWLSALTAVGLRVQRLLPDVLALPVNSHGWSAVKLGEQWLIRQNAYAGFVMEEAGLKTLLPHWTPPVSVITYTQPGELPETWQLEAEQEAMCLMAAQQTDNLPNFLTGVFKPKVSHRGKSLWAVTVGLALLLLTLQGVNLAVAGYQQQQRAEHLRQQALAEYQQLFPQDKKTVSQPKASLAKQLALLEARSVSPGFLWLLTRANQSMNPLSQVEIVQLHYNVETQVLSLQINAKTLPALHAPAGTELKIERNNAGGEAGPISARLIFRRQP